MLPVGPHLENNGLQQQLAKSLGDDGQFLKGFFGDTPFDESIVLVVDAEGRTAPVLQHVVTAVLIKKYICSACWTKRHFREENILLRDFSRPR